MTDLDLGKQIIAAIRTFRTNLEETPPHDQRGRLETELCWSNLLRLAQSASTASFGKESTRIGAALANFVAQVNRFDTEYVAKYGISGCLNGVPMDPNPAIITTLVFPVFDEFRRLEAEFREILDEGIPPIEEAKKNPKRGRKQQYDPIHDQQFYEDWQRAKGVGITFKDFCKDRGVQVSKGKQTIDRSRKRLAE